MCVFFFFLKRTRWVYARAICWYGERKEDGERKEEEKGESCSFFPAFSSPPLFDEFPFLLQRIVLPHGISVILFLFRYYFMLPSFSCLFHLSSSCSLKDRTLSSSSSSLSIAYRLTFCDFFAFALSSSRLGS